ncbi:hypothetical protein J1N35_016338 [Gossypium stocksii]|uniref:Uncharacterized protein n=1 Tax=Gossypium stocksii TaxID=47602 RepID=A0A9D4A521_9ROSI|nr:hypothetical protein J1N35_016338 [Gossypium stocksii]
MSSPSSYEPENLRWSTGKACLYSGLFLVISLMTMLLLKLLCSKLQPESNLTPSNHSERPMYQPNRNKLEDYDMPASDEVFVIMAGEERPSCLAKPMVAVASVAQLCEQV